MGSRGYGDFGSYKQDSNNLKCGSNLGIINLENVESFDYYSNTSSLPSVGESVHVKYHKQSQRIVVISEMNDSVIGALPVKFNFIRICLEQGFEYSGDVYATNTYPVIKVEVKINAS